MGEISIKIVDGLLLVMEINLSEHGVVILTYFFFGVILTRPLAIWLENVCAWGSVMPYSLYICMCMSNSYAQTRVCSFLLTESATAGVGTSSVTHVVLVTMANRHVNVHFGMETTTTTPLRST